MEYNKEELENMSYDDIAYDVLKNNNTTMTTAELFKKICGLLEMSDKQYESGVADFYTLLTVDKRFVIIDAKWDLKEKHPANTIIDDELEDLDETDELEELDDENLEDEKEDEDLDGLDALDEEDIDEVDDLEGLEIIEDEEIEEEE